MAVVCRIVRVVSLVGMGFFALLAAIVMVSFPQEVERNHAVAKAFSAAAAWIDDCDRAKGRLPRPTTTSWLCGRGSRTSTTRPGRAGAPWTIRSGIMSRLCCLVFSMPPRRLAAGMWRGDAGRVCSSMSRTHRGSRIREAGGASTVPLSPAWAFLPCTASLCVLCG